MWPNTQMLFELYSGASSVGPSGSSSSSLSMHPTRPTDHRLNRLSVSLECSFGRRRVVYRFLRAGLATPCLSEPGTIPLYLCYRQAIAFMQPSLQGCLHMAVSLAVCLTLSGCLSVLFSVCFFTAALRTSTWNSTTLEHVYTDHRLSGKPTPAH